MQKPVIYNPYKPQQGIVQFDTATKSDAMTIVNLAMSRNQLVRFACLGQMSDRLVDGEYTIVWRVEVDRDVIDGWFASFVGH